MKILAALSAFTLAAALVAAPYQIVRAPARATTLKDLDIKGASEGSCPKGGFIRLELADGLLFLGENGKVVKAEPSNDGDGFPTITLGTWDAQTGEIALHAKTKHKAQPGDGLCTDLFPGDA
jgi:hypothetical protein